MAGRRRTMKKLLFAMAIGAALAWLFDPDNGPRRRETVKRRLEEKGVMSPSSSSNNASSNSVPNAVSAIR